MLGGLGVVALGPLVGCAGTMQAAEPPRPAPAPPRAPERTPPPPPAAEASAPAKEEEEEPIEEAPPSAPGEHRLALPPRKRRADSGTRFMERTAGMRAGEFEEAAFEEIAGGNVPAFQRALVPVRVRTSARKGKAHSGIVFVLCDYLAVGSDDDFVRLPVTPRTAQRIAALADCILPTPKLVDAIYRQAPAKLPPRYIEGGPTLSNRLDYLTHNKDLEEQRAQRRLALGQLTAGDKKDIVITNRLVKKVGRVAIYGWQREDGGVIQHLSTVHSKNYADYSHGVRLISGAMTVDGEERRVEAVLRDPDLCSLLSNEGPLEIVAYPA
jgi:hypothetical protein